MISDDCFFDSYEQQPEQIKKELHYLKITEIINPLFISLTDEKPNRYDKNVLFLCRKNNTVDSTINLLFEKIVDQTMFREALNSISCIQCDFPVMKSEIHQKRSVILDSNFLKELSLVLNLDLNFERAIGVVMLELNETDCKLYLNGFNNTVKCNTVLSTKMMFNYFKVQGINLQMIQRLEGANYWCTKRTFADKFTNRMFQSKKQNVTVTVKEPIRQLQLNKYNNTSNQESYDVNILPVNKPDSIPNKPDKIDDKIDNKPDKIDNKPDKIDNKPDNIDNKSDNNLVETELLTVEKVLNIFNVLTTEKEKYDMFNAMLLSNDKVHLVLNNKSLLQQLTPMITKFLPLYKYLFGYAWLTLYVEENYKNLRTTVNDRFVFDIDTANALPFFPYIDEDVHMNPYCTLLTSTELINSTNNCLGLSMIKNHDDYGVDSLQGFKRKFNIFTSDLNSQQTNTKQVNTNININIFDGLETDETGAWKHFAISGSIIAACCTKRNPLTYLFENVKDDARFFREFNSNSDIDIMCNSQTVFEYLNNVYDLYNTVKQNTSKILNKDVNSSFKIEPIKTLTVFVDSTYNAQLDKDVNSNEFKEHFYEMYFNTKIQNNKVNRKDIKDRNCVNPLYEEFFKITRIDDMNIIVIDMTNSYKESKETNTLEIVQENGLIKITESVKFKIRSEFIPRVLEVFHIKSSDYFSCVSKFHLPCVRGYYDGSNVYLLPSCITALMTYLNIDYKYFASVHDPAEIINKYRLRGFGTVLNSAEKAHLTDYNKSNNSISSLNQFGGKSIRNTMFMKSSSASYNTTNREYILSIEHLYSYYKDNYKYDSSNSVIDLLRLKTINVDGTVNEFKPWILDAAYDILS